MLSLPEAEAEALALATLADIERHRQTPKEREAERMERDFQRHCRKTWPEARRRARR
jgi:hypothetical protein